MYLPDIENKNMRIVSLKSKPDIGSIDGVFAVVKKNYNNTNICLCLLCAVRVHNRKTKKISLTNLLFQIVLRWNSDKECEKEIIIYKNMESCKNRLIIDSKRRIRLDIRI